MRENKHDASAPPCRYNSAFVLRYDKTPIDALLRIAGDPRWEYRYVMKLLYKLLNKLALAKTG